MEANAYMHNKIRRIWILLLSVFLLLIPTIVLAQEGTQGDGTATAVTLSLIGFVILLVAFIVIIAAVSLGIILIGAAVSQGGDE